MSTTDWSFWSILPAVMSAVVAVAYGVQLWLERDDERPSALTSGGLWTEAGLLIIVAAYLPILTLDVARWVALPGIILVFIGPWLRRRASRKRGTSDHAV